MRPNFSQLAPAPQLARATAQTATHTTTPGAGSHTAGTPEQHQFRQQRQYRRQARSPPASDSSSQVKGRQSQPPEPIRPNSTRCKRPLRRPLRDGRRPCPTSRTWRPRTVFSQGTRRRRRQPVRSRRHSGQPARLHPRRTLLRLPRMPPADLVRGRS
jgi:hypothetical protein